LALKEEVMTADRTEQRELERLSRALRTLSASNRALLRAQDEKGLLQEICRAVAEEAGYRAAIVVRAEHDERKSITTLARAGIVEVFDEVTSLTWDDSEQGRSATGTAIRSGVPCLVNRVDNGQLGERWQDFAHRHGFGALFSLPLRVDGEVYGALTILAPEADAFQDLEKAPLLEAADDLAFGLQLLRARERAAVAQETIRRITQFDAVSGLPNRAHLRTLLASALAAARQQCRPMALLRLELERYRDIEEALGDAEANRLVTAVAAKLQAAVEPQGVLAHIAEAEFAIVLPNAGAEQAGRFAQALLSALSDPADVAGLLLDARARVGVSLHPGHGDEAEILMRRAGAALGFARRSGSGLAFFKGGLDVESAQRIALMTDLRRAIERNELELFCQPKAHVDSRRVHGAEALVRWQHPSRGLLGPGQFIPLAESTGMITPLTYWVLDAVLRQGYGWRQSGLSHPLSVNLSAHDFRDPRLVDRIGGALNTWGAEPDSIEFELTESALMEDPEGALRTLAELKRLDVTLTIDDYGTGYSSLSYLRRLPVDGIKIDQSFVREMSRSQDAAMIVRSTIELAHNLKLKVIAEGVEDESTFTTLSEFGCDMAQGFCISRPMPASAFPTWAQQQP
jgi:diguanylate cyclase (GGDEF)-like protein